MLKNLYIINMQIKKQDTHMIRGLVFV